MSDFPGGFPMRPVISWLSPECIGANKVAAFSATAPSSGIWTSANRAIFIPLLIRAPYPVRKVWWANGTSVSGNCDVGVYTEGGARLFSSGSTAQATTSVIQSVALGSTFLLMPGRYYIAMAMDNNTGHIIRLQFSNENYGKAFGFVEQATAFALPLSATFATVFTYDTIPVFGITSRTTI